MSSLQELISEIKKFLGNSPETIEDFQPIMEKYSGEDYKKFLTFSYEKYTRNVIEKNPDFELVLVGWEKGQSCLPHSHADNGCVMKILQGEIYETRYYENGSEKDFLYEEGCVSYIHNSDALHKIENKSIHNRAVTLHLYAPGEYEVTFGEDVEKLWKN